MQASDIKYEKRGPVALITLNRPAESNLITPALASGIGEVVQRIKDDDQIRVVVVTGAGEAFSRGSDLDAPALLAGGTSWQEVKEAIQLRRAANKLASIECPVIAAVNGDALGQGLELALTCDLRFVSESARLGLDQIASGFLPWDGGTQRLPRIIGRSLAVSMIMLGDVIDAREALRVGLAHGVYHKDALLQEALALADKIATYAPLALRYAKEAVNKGMDMTLDQGLRLEQDLTVILQSTEDRAEGIRSFLEKRSPRYLGR